MIFMEYSIKILRGVIMFGKKNQMGAYEPEQDPKQRKKGKKLFIILGIIGVLFVAGALGSKSDNKTSSNSVDSTKTETKTITNTTSGEKTTTSAITTTQTTTPTTAAVTTTAKTTAAATVAKVQKIKSGNYKIGADLPAGEYKIIADSGFSYMEVSKDSSGTLDSIIANDNVTTFTYITVEEGQYLTIKYGHALKMEDVTPYEPKEGLYKDGMYKVGFDVPAGEYNVIGDGNFAYVEVSSDSYHGLESIITNDILDGNKHITVEDGQYLTLKGASFKR